MAVGTFFSVLIFKIRWLDFFIQLLHKIKIFYFECSPIYWVLAPLPSIDNQAASLLVSN